MARRPGLLSPFAFVRRMGIYRGLLGGSRGWLYAGGAMWGFRLIKKLFGKTEKTIALEKLKPGQFVRVEAIPAPTRRQRKAAKRDRKSAKRTR